MLFFSKHVARKHLAAIKAALFSVVLFMQVAPALADVFVFRFPPIRSNPYESYDLIQGPNEAYARELLFNNRAQFSRGRPVEVVERCTASEGNGSGWWVMARGETNPGYSDSTKIMVATCGHRGTLAEAVRRTRENCLSTRPNCRTMVRWDVTAAYDDGKTHQPVVPYDGVSRTVTYYENAFGSNGCSCGIGVKRELSRTRGTEAVCDMSISPGGASCNVILDIWSR